MLPRRILGDSKSPLVGNSGYKKCTYAESKNLCKCKDSDPEVSVISAVFGICRVNKDVMCDDQGCSGSVDFE